MASSIRFYFDVLSPYSYLAWTQLPALADRHGLTIEPRPVLFGAVLSALGTKGPAEVPPRRIYTFKHIVRLAHDVGVPIQPPPSHPFSPLLALRVCCAAIGKPDQNLVISGVFDAVWRTGHGAETPDQVAAALNAVGADTRGLVADASQPAIKERLRRHTDELIAAGGFGVPTLIVDNELFFGLDSFGHIERFLKGGDPVTPSVLAAWRHTPATVRRPGS
jgi:2-hydroxychromene-2-carboxylate isomerase